MIYLDTSFLYSLIMKDQMHPFCQIIWDDTQSQRLTVAVSMLTICETLSLIENRERISKIEVIDSINSVLKVQKCRFIGSDSVNVFKEAVPLWQKYGNVDFFDILHYLTMKSRGIEEIYSLDEHFDLFKDIRRVFRSF